MELWVGLVRVRKRERANDLFDILLLHFIRVSGCLSGAREKYFAVEPISFVHFSEFFFPFSFSCIMVTQTYYTLAEHKSLCSIYPEGIISIYGNKIAFNQFSFS
jgi:hypothetical protein